MKKQIFFLLFLLAPLGIQAQETVSLAQCREMALKNNKEMAAAHKQSQGAIYTARSYKGLFFPNFTANGLGLYSNAGGNYKLEGGNLPIFQPDATGQIAQTMQFAYFPGIELNYKVGMVYSAGVQVDQPLYMGGKIMAAYKTAVMGREMTKLNEQLTATEVVLQTETAYAQVVQAKELKKAAEAYHAVLDELLQDVKHAKAQGMKSQNDLLKVQVKCNESELSLRKADNALRLATMNLCHLIGKPLYTDLQVTDGFPTLENQMQLQTTDITARPEYAILNQKTEIARQQVKLSRSELLPQIGIRGTYSYMHGLELNDEVLMYKGSFSVMLNVSIPIYHFGARTNKVKAAKMKLEQTRLEQASINEKMLLELTQAANNLDEARLESDISSRSLEQAQENMRVSKKQFEVGRESLSDHLEAQALWQQAYAQHVNAHFQLYLSYLAYQKAAGTLKTE